MTQDTPKIEPKCPVCGMHVVMLLEGRCGNCERDHMPQPTPAQGDEAPLAMVNSIQLARQYQVMSECQETLATAKARIIRLQDTLRRVLDEKAPAYHDCTDNGEEECAWCQAFETFAETAPAQAESAGEGEKIAFADAIDPNAAWNRRARKSAQKYRKNALIEAVQWFKLGDHPAVRMVDDVTEAMRLGQAVPWISTLEGGHLVTPGDWIATGIKGEHWPIKPDVFAATYEPIPTSPTAPDDVERVARALYCAQEEIQYEQNVAHVEYWFSDEECAKNGDAPHREEYERMARAAIAAMNSASSGNEGEAVAKIIVDLADREKRAIKRAVFIAGDYVLCDDDEADVEDLAEEIACPTSGILTPLGAAIRGILCAQPSQSEEVVADREAGYAEAESMLRDLLTPDLISDTAIRVARDHLMQFARHRLASQKGG